MTNKITLIIACDQDFNIGKDNDLLVRIKKDLQNFKEITMGHNLYMGRKTFESTGNLPGRKSHVLSRGIVEGADVNYNDKDQFLEALKNDEKGFLVGGASVIQMFYDEIDEILMTRILKKFDADRKIDDPLTHGFKIVDESEVYEEDGIKFKFVHYKK